MRSGLALPDSGADGAAGAEPARSRGSLGHAERSSGSRKALGADAAPGLSCGARDGGSWEHIELFLRGAWGGCCCIRSLKAERARRPAIR